MKTIKKILVTVLATAVLMLGMQVASFAGVSSSQNGAALSVGDTVNITITFGAAQGVEIYDNPYHLSYVSGSTNGNATVLNGSCYTAYTPDGSAFSSVTLTYRVTGNDATCSISATTFDEEGNEKGSTSGSFAAKTQAAIAEEKAAEAARQAEEARKKAEADEAARKAAEAEATRRAQEQQSNPTPAPTPSYVEPQQQEQQAPAVEQNTTTNDVAANVVDANTIANTTVDNTVKTENTISNTTKTTGTVETIEDSEGIKPIVIVAICTGSVLLICVGYYIFIVKRKKKSKSKPSGFDDF